MALQASLIPTSPLEHAVLRVMLGPCKSCGHILQCHVKHDSLNMNHSAGEAQPMGMFPVNANGNSTLTNQYPPNQNFKASFFKTIMNRRVEC
jgi:hypothetical protein